MYLNFVVNYFFLLICQSVDQMQLAIKTSTEAGALSYSSVCFLASGIGVFVASASRSMKGCVSYYHKLRDCVVVKWHKLSNGLCVMFLFWGNMKFRDEGNTPDLLNFQYCFEKGESQKVLDKNSVVFSV